MSRKDFISTGRDNMRSRSIVVFLSLLIFISYGCSKRQIEKRGLIQVSPHCYAYVAEGLSPSQGLGANSGFVVGERGVLVVDSRFAPSLAEVLLKEIRSVTDKPIRFLVNTHYHPEHTWGNEVFKREGAVIIGTDETIRDMKQYTPYYLEYYRKFKRNVYSLIERVNLTPPDTVVRDDMKLNLGGVSVVIRKVENAHTAGDCIVFVPSEGVLYTGGILVNGFHPNMGDRGVDLDRWLGILGRFLDMKVKYFVPAQGYVCGKGAVRENIEYISQIRKQCREFITEGVLIQDAIEKVNLPVAEGYQQANLLPFNIQAVYRKELEGLVRPPFTIDIPDGYFIVDGAGNMGRGTMKWGTEDESGYREIEISWQPTYLKSLIVQDVRDRVARFLKENSSIDMKVDTTGFIKIGENEWPYVQGSWRYRKELMRAGGGLFMWTLIAEKNKLFSIKLLSDTNLELEKDVKNIGELKGVVSTLQVQ